jgi:protein translocase SecG subunit
MTVLQITQIIFALLVVILVVLQSKGMGLSSMVSGSFGHYRSRRGAEKAVFFFTILGIIAFALNSILLIMYN